MRAIVSTFVFTLVFCKTAHLLNTFSNIYFASITDCSYLKLFHLKLLIRLLTTYPIFFEIEQP